MNYNQRKLQHHSLSVLLNTAFDPDQFSQMPIEGANSTEAIPFEDKECPGVIDKIDFRQITSEKDQKVYLALDVSWDLDSPEDKQRMGRDKILGRQTIFLDRLENGSLDMGKGRNVQLGLLREATGLNNPGQAFQFIQLVGRPALCKAKDREYEGQHFVDVKSVTKR